MLHVFYGNDEFRVSEALRALRAALDPDGMLSTNTSTLAGRGLTPDQLIQHAAAVPFLGGTRLVIVEGLLQALGNRRGVVESWQKLVDFLPQMPESSHVVLVEPTSARDARDRRDPGVGRSPLLRELQELPGVEVHEFRELSSYGSRSGPSELARWLYDRAAEQSIAIEGDALDALVGLIGSHLRLLATELEKLATYAGDRAITADDVHLLTSQAREESVFGLVDAVVEGRGAVALRVLSQILDEPGQTPIYLQSMLARQFRHLVRATEVLELRGDEAAVGAATGVRNRFALGKLVRQARATSRAAAEAGLREVERSDQLVKTGKLDDVLALELLTLRLASIAGGRGGGQRRRAAPAAAR